MLCISQFIKEYFDAIIFIGRAKSYYDKNGIHCMNSNDIFPQYIPNQYLEILTNSMIENKHSMHLIAQEFKNKLLR